jgi:hypothetical protein
MLHLEALLLCECPLSFWHATFTLVPDVLVVANCLFGKSSQDVMLILLFLNPISHDLKHFTLEFRIMVMEVGMEAKNA